MTEHYRDLVEGLAARAAPGPASFPCDPRKAAAWVNTLPRANPAATSTMLEKALLDLRGQRREGLQRLAVLEVLRPLALELIRGLHQQCQGTSIPLPPPKARLFETLQRIEAELATGYRIAVVEACAPSGSVPFLRGGNVALGLERAMFHSARVLEHAYQVYQQPGPGAWLQLHRLYGFAQSVKLQDKAIEDTEAGRPMTVAALYAKALLLALSNPYRFGQRDQQELAAIGPDLGARMALRGSRIDEHSLGVPCASDRGPGYLASEREESGERLLWIDLSELRGVVEQAVAAGASEARLKGLGGRMLSVSTELLARLRDGWGRATERRNQRLSASHSLETAIGMSGLHFHLAGLVDFETFLRQAGDDSAVDAGEDEQRAVWAHVAVDAGRVPLQKAEVVDQSLGGYQLRWPAEEAVKARVGELVGLSVSGEGEERQWVLGVIRWLRYDAQGAVDAGVQLLARRVRPVALRVLDGNGSARQPLRGIEYEPVRGGEEGALHFSAAGLIEAGARRIEVLRVPDINDLDAPVRMREIADAPEVAENAGDYLLLRARRAGEPG